MPNGVPLREATKSARAGEDDCGTQIPFRSVIEISVYKPSRDEYRSRGECFLRLLGERTFFLGGAGVRLA